MIGQDASVDDREAAKVSKGVGSRRFGTFRERSLVVWNFTPRVPDDTGQAAVLNPTNGPRGHPLVSKELQIRFDNPRTKLRALVQEFAPGNWSVHQRLVSELPCLLGH
jgi:hypothetical protein